MSEQVLAATPLPSQYPPAIYPTALPASPVRESANGTTSPPVGSDPHDNISAAQMTELPKSDATTQDLPTPAVPGAYPRELDENATPADIAGNVKRSGSRVIETARQYVPQSVASYFPAPPAQTHKTTASTQGSTFEETSSDRRVASNGVDALPGALSEGVIPKQPEEHAHMCAPYKGVGALPGSISEDEVAKLPAERAQTGAEDIPRPPNHATTNTLEDIPQPATDATTNTLLAPHMNAFALPSNYSTTAQAGSTASSFVARAGDTPTPGAGGHSGVSGVAGDLPGSYSDAEGAALAAAGSQPTDPSASGGVRGRPGAPGGVGDLPGSRSETGVAVLPEERKSKSPHTNGAPKSSQPSNAGGVPFGETQPSAGGFAASGGPLGYATKTGGVGDLPGGPHEASVAVVPDERNSAKLADKGHSTKRGGVGDLPGRASETAVAVLPDERHGSKADHKEAEHNGSANQAVTSKPHDAKAGVKGIDPAAPAQEPEHESGPPAGFDGYGSGYHPAADHPMTAAPPEKTQAAAPAVPEKTRAATPPPVDDATNGTARHARSGSTGSVGHKPSIMDKLKGEAKVLAGKMTRNDEKVEAGRRMMGKE